jgi:hypothetical protein
MARHDYAVDWWSVAALLRDGQKVGWGMPVGYSWAKNSTLHSVGFRHLPEVKAQEAAIFRRMR